MAYAAYVFCNQCGHRNPPERNFCSSCGAPLDLGRDDRTIALHPVDPRQDAPGPTDDVVVEPRPSCPPGVGAAGRAAAVRRPGTRFALERRRHPLGRHPDSDIFLDDITVSRRHAEIERVAAGYVVRDVGSLNGTYVNRERIEEDAALDHGDELQVGKFKLVFFIGPDEEQGRVSMHDRAHLSIGEVLGLLQEEFPDVTISKIRFLESQGLIDPERTPSGYRKFYDGDVERLRFILREQKEHFLPLKVIKDRLDSGEPAASNGVPVAEPEAAAAAGPREPSWMAAARERAGQDPGNGAALTSPAAEVGELTADQLCAATGLSRRDLGEVERYGLVVGRLSGGVTYYDDDAYSCARLAAAFLSHGVEPRHLRLYRNSVDREAALFEQVVMPLLKQRNPQARTQAASTLMALSRNGSELRQALLHQALRAYVDPSG